MRPFGPPPTKRIAKAQIAIARQIMPIYRMVLPQLASIGFSVRITAKGVVIEEYVNVAKDSLMAKLMACQGTDAASLMDRLPSLPYFMAGGEVGTGPLDEEVIKFYLDIFDKILVGSGSAKLSPGKRAEISKLTNDFADQIKLGQIFLGAAPKGSGVFGLAMVYQCKDAQKVKGLIAQETKLIDELFKQVLAKPFPRLKGFRFTYAKGVEKLAGLDVDAIQITHPKQADIKPKDKQQMIKLLGEAEIRLLVAAPDKNTVVVTFGGSKGFLAQAIKAAKGGGKLARSTGIAVAMKEMPDKPTMVFLFNVGGLFDILANGAEALGLGADVLDVRIKCQEPVVMGASTSGTAAHVVIYVPSALVAEIVDVAMKKMAPKPPGTGKPLSGVRDL